MTAPIDRIRSQGAALLAVVLSSLLFAGCATPPFQAPAVQAPVARPDRFDEAAVALRGGVGHYEAGRYEQATHALRYALDLGLRTPAETVQAHKHLAFMLCAGGKGAPCREEFRAALRIDPAFKLGKAEAGHPMWGPAFVEVRKEFAAGAR